MLSSRNIALAAAALATGAMLFPAGAGAAQPSCGDTITHDVKLNADLDCSSHAGDALIIGKNGVTVDLNGHTLTGPGSYEGINDYTPGYDNFVVKDGTVEKFQYGVDLEYTTGSKILNVTGQNNTYSDFYFQYSQNGTIKGVHASAPSYGIYLYENEKVNVLNSKASGGGGGYGIYDYESRSTLKHVTAKGYNYGLYIYDPIKGYKVLDSKANDNGDRGIYVYGNYPVSVYQATVSDNVADDNVTYGFYADVNTLGSGNSAHGNGIENCFHVKC